MKVLFVFGTRPEAIKMAPLIKKLSGDSTFEVEVCVTGQHREMLDQVLNIFDITPDYDLDIMKKNQDLIGISSLILNGLSSVYKKASPNIVLVHGDTTTTLLASLTAYYMKIPIGHIEAGLRTNDIYSPWPEEGNRRLVGPLAAMHFAPTVMAKNNLLNEGVKEENIFVTGNTVIDALLSIIEKLKSDSSINEALSKELNFLDPNKKILLLTCHRRENLGENLENICLALKNISQRREDIQIIYPVHMNPKIREIVNRILGECENIHLIEPLDYLPFIYLMDKSYIIISDSGGIQEEAPSLGKPVLLLRETSERPEAVEAGTVKLIGTNPDKVFNEINMLLDNSLEYERMKKARNPFGDGFSSGKIANELKNRFLISN